MSDVLLGTTLFLAYVGLALVFVATFRRAFGSGPHRCPLHTCPQCQGEVRHVSKRGHRR